MDTLNKKLIKAHKRLDEISKQKEELEKEYKYLQDFVHLSLDSSSTNTVPLEMHITENFWANAYKHYKDGGYITNDEYIVDVRFKYETKLLKGIIEKKCNRRYRALDIGCGNGRYTKFFANEFEYTVGIDLSEDRIKINNQENKKKNIEYIYANFMSMNGKDIGKFDFVFVGDIFMYTPKKMVKKVFNSLLSLLNPNGVLVVRESTYTIGKEDYKSKNYVAYYRNVNFYKKGKFKPYFEKVYKNSAYNLYHLEKYFNLKSGKRKSVQKKPDLLDDIVDKYVNKSLRTNHFYVYRGLKSE